MGRTVFFSTFMGGIIYFFILAGNLFSPYAWIYALFLYINFILMIKNENWSKHRKIFQITLAILFTISFIGILYDERGAMTVDDATFQDAEVPFCHIVIPVTLIPMVLSRMIIFPARMIGHFASILGMFLIWVITSLTIGRGWCSWVCFYGGWEEGAASIAKKPRLKLDKHSKNMRAIHFAFLFFIVLVSVALLSPIYCEWFCPFKLVTEYAEINGIRDLIITVVFIALFLGLVITLPFLSKKRVQCSTLCPFGAFQSLCDKVSRVGIKIDTEKCISCMKCVSACPFAALDRETIMEKKGKPEITCAKCGDCIAVCPVGAIDFAYKGIGRSSSKKIKKSDAEGQRTLSAPLRFFYSLMEARYIFVFMAYTLSVIISGRFGVDALERLWNIISGGWA